MDKTAYVRKRLKEASKARGQLVQIARVIGADQRTVRAVLDTEHAPHVATLDKLLAYFKKEDRRANQ